MVVLNFLQAQKYISDKEKHSIKEVTPTKKMNRDDQNIQCTDPNESNKYFDYESIQRKSSDVSSRHHIV